LNTTANYEWCGEWSVWERVPEGNNKFASKAVVKFYGATALLRKSLTGILVSSPEIRAILDMTTLSVIINKEWLRAIR